MNTIPFVMSITSLFVIIVSWILYLRTIPKMIVPVDAIGTKIMQGLGIALGTSAIILNGQASESSRVIAVFVPAIIAIMMGFGFFWLFAQRKTPIGDLKVKPGDRILPFSAVTSKGEKFHSDEMAGKRILLKFYRGGW